MLLRLRLLRLDLNEQLAQILVIVALIVCAAALLLVSLTALLLGLNVVLSPETKKVVFFGIAVGTLLMVGVLVWQIPKRWQQSSERVGNTLNQIQNDLRLFSQSSQRKEPKHEIKQS